MFYKSLFTFAKKQWKGQLAEPVSWGVKNEYFRVSKWKKQFLKKAQHTLLYPFKQCVGGKTINFLRWVTIRIIRSWRIVEKIRRKKKKSRGPNISDEKWMLWKQTKPSDFHNEWKIWLCWKQHMVVLQKAEHRMEKWKIETIPIQTEWFENK